MTLAIPVHAQMHTTGFRITKTCPALANAGDAVMCTITVENQDSDHGVNDLVVTNEVPFPGGVPSPVDGCASVLGPNDGVADAGPDFTSCIVEEILDEPCDDATILVADQAVAAGFDADPVAVNDGGFGGIPVSRSTTSSITILCSTPTPKSTPTDTPTSTPTDTPRPLGAACTEPGHCASGFCVDGVCCESLCAGPHEACDRPGHEGSCLRLGPAPVPVLSLPGLAAVVIALGLVTFQALRRRRGI